VLLKMKEVNRLRVVQGYMHGKILIEEASRILKRSLRSVDRMVAKVREKGQRPSCRPVWLPRTRGARPPASNFEF
jgi:transposase